MHSRTKMGKAAVVAALVVAASAAAASVAAQQSDPQAPPAQPPAAQAPAAETPGAVTARIVTAAATIKKIDKANRQVTLKDSAGKTIDIKAGPDVNIDKLHAGDRVTATYYEEVAVAINQASKGAPKMTTTTVERGGVTARQATITARIVSVDPTKNTVVIRGPDGNTHSLEVQDPALQGRLRQIKAGENFDVTYTQAVALTVEPRK
jgi:hypothetical protein